MSKSFTFSIFTKKQQSAIDYIADMHMVHRDDIGVSITSYMLSKLVDMGVLDYDSESDVWDFTNTFFNHMVSFGMIELKSGERTYKKWSELTSEEAPAEAPAEEEAPAAAAPAAAAPAAPKATKRHITSFRFWDFDISIYYVNDGISKSGFEFTVSRAGALLTQSEEEYRTPPLAGIGALEFLEGYYGEEN